MSSHKPPSLTDNHGPSHTHATGPLPTSRASATVSVRCGTSVSAHEGNVGSVAALVVDVHNTAVTHLVVSNGDAAGEGRLVPLSCAATGDGELVELDRNRADVLSFELCVIPYQLGDPKPRDGRSEGLGSRMISRGAFTLHLDETAPETTLALRRPVSVRTRNGGLLGVVESWQLERATGRIQCILVRWGRSLNRTGLPISGPLIDHIDDDGVHLAVQIERLLGN